MDTVMTSWSTYSGADFIRLNAPHFFPSLSHIITGLFVDPKTELGKGEFRTDGWEELPHAPKPEAKGSSGEEQPHDRGQGRWPGGPTPYPRSRGCAGTGGPRGATTLKARKGGGEEIPLVQGKEQWLRFAGAAVKRYPTPKVRETQVRW